MALRLGDLLVRRGVLTEAQRDEILMKQRELGRPFGVLAEDLFNVSPLDVERAWAEQYAEFAQRLTHDQLRPSIDVLTILDRRQAWQFRLIPIELSESGELTFCTTEISLPRALRFVNWRFAHPSVFVLASEHDLGAALEQHYPLAGLTASDLARVAG